MPWSLETTHLLAYGMGVIFLVVGGCGLVANLVVNRHNKEYGPLIGVCAFVSALGIYLIAWGV